MAKHKTARRKRLSVSGFALPTRPRALLAVCMLRTTACGEPVEPIVAPPEEGLWVGDTDFVEADRSGGPDDEGSICSLRDG